MTPAAVTGNEVLVEVDGLGEYLAFPGPAQHDVSEQHHPSSRTQHAMRFGPADRRVDPVHEAATTTSKRRPEGPSP